MSEINVANLSYQNVPSPLGGSYTEKKLVRSSPMAHLRIFVKDMAHLLGIVRPT